jgi:hypothetical protein
MMKILEELVDSNDFDFSKILVEVRPQKEHETTYAQDIFLEINKAIPVELVDMPGVVNNKTQQIITGAAERLETKYPEMFSSSRTPRAPNLNIDKLRDRIYQRDVIGKFKIKSAAALEKWMLAENDKLAEKYATEEAQSTVNKRALDKASTHKFYLGLDSSWLHDKAEE